MPSEIIYLSKYTGKVCVCYFVFVLKNKPGVKVSSVSKILRLSGIYRISISNLQFWTESGDDILLGGLNKHW